MNLVDKILKISKIVFDDKKLNSHSKLSDASGYDSMTHVQLLVEIFEQLGVAVDYTEIASDSTIEDVAKLLEAKS